LVGLLWMSDQVVAETSTWQHTQNSQQRNIHAPRGIRTHYVSKRTAADPRLRPRGNWDRRYNYQFFFFRQRSLLVVKNKISLFDIIFIENACLFNQVIDGILPPHTTYTTPCGDT
jgi:hypothetical protein